MQAVVPEECMSRHLSLILAIAGCSGAPAKSSASATSSRPSEPVAPAIRFELDLPYADADDLKHRLDLYLPSVHDGAPLPVIVFFPGGTARGSKTDGSIPLMPFLRTGRYAAVSVGYRPPTLARWPAQLDDAKAAIRWIRSNAKRYRLDPDHIGVLGRGAGGHLALMLGVTGDVPGLEGDVGDYTTTSSRVTAVASFFGGEAQAIDARPTTYVTDNDPPILSVDSADLRSYDETARLDAALREVGVASFFIEVEGTSRDGFGNLAEGRVEAFFARYLRGENAVVPTTPIELLR